MLHLLTMTQHGLLDGIKLASKHTQYVEAFEAKSTANQQQPRTCQLQVPAASVSGPCDGHSALDWITELIMNQNHG